MQNYLINKLLRNYLTKVLLIQKFHGGLNFYGMIFVRHYLYSLTSSNFKKYENIKFIFDFNVELNFYFTFA
ncbi:hypothetical protein EG359_09505 [Chryseobacterium joostei]|uniref:Uncharacterized protein n=1 Tax=Chryseobacterium joostei TaxID=112234 RepID=A0ABN5SAJ9_9FLAO|nr:hypothetical protein EG359_09505 [Chryseobacterium joostei]